MKNNGVKAITAATLLVGGAIAVTPALAVELAINGDFSAGLTGWTDFLTPNGTDDNGAVAYDVTGSGSSAALRMYNVGNTGSAGPGGGGVFQIINIAGSSDVNVTFSADYAAVIGGDTAGNLSGGIFSLLIDGVVTNSGPPVIIDGGKVANTDSGAIRYHEVHRG